MKSRKNTPKNTPPKNTFSCLKCPPYRVFLQHRTLDIRSGWETINMPLAIPTCNLYHLQSTLRDY